MRLSFLTDPPPPPMRWVWRDIVPAASLVTIAGAPGGGKTAVSVALALAVARGDLLLDRETVQGSVLIVSAEAAHSTARRLRAAAGDDLSLPIGHATGQIDLLDPDSTNRIIGAIDKMRERFERPVRLVVLDALASATRGADENSGREMSRALGSLHEVIHARGASVLLLAHTAKAGGNQVRGHSSILADADVHLSLTGNSSIRRMTIVKARDFEAGSEVSFRLSAAPTGAFRMETVEGVTRSTTHPSRLSRDARTALNALTDLGEQATLDKWRSAAAAAFGPRPSAGAVREAFRKAKASLLTAGLISIDGQIVTVTDDVTDVTSGDASNGGGERHRERHHPTPY
ncbi:AAA family ATPase [Xanthobacter tagetidis]|uniref:AAA family ATPase n=1 Tax=Xanthobacter tagetidis TaxID=60216 RepID=A0A3L7AFU8_9HYPH|nr:AAA family ATPase [Xanthobacter tagetidis]MBB6309699.1 hypothetical protein [Xanthobacter tagetidis]RLP78262.1 hypothetical protein D9R14_12860 [Xanthobacter tagetidis]